MVSSKIDIVNGRREVMAMNFLDKKRGLLLLVFLVTVISYLLAMLITYAIIKIAGKGDLGLGLFIASTCSLFITPPISGFIFILLRKLHHSRIKLEASNRELENALGEVKILSGLLPICSKCKKVRDSQGYWKKIESYFEDHSDLLFSHGLCEHCLEDLYGDKKWYLKNKPTSLNSNDS